MTSRLRVESTLLLPDGTMMMRATVIEGSQVHIGQRGVGESSDANLIGEVIGTGVSDPNLASFGRQGILFRLIQGEPGRLEGVVLRFSDSS